MLIDENLYLLYNILYSEFDNQKICSNCKKSKDITFFYKNGKILQTCLYCRQQDKKCNRKRLSLTKEQKELRKIYDKKRREKRKDLTRFENQKFKKNNPVYFSNYYIKNKEYINEKSKINRANNYFSYLITELRKRAKEKCLDFNLTQEYLLNIDSNICPYFGYNIKTSNNGVCFNSKSVDRINNNFGYVQGNIEFISLRANTIKGNSLIEEQESIIRYMENYKPVNNNIQDVINIYGEYKLKNLFINKKSRAKIDDIYFDLLFYDFISIFPLNKKCQAFDIDLNLNAKRADNDLLSIDRVDQNLGYIKENIAIICYRANRLKNTATLDELKIMVNRRKKLEENKRLYGKYIV